MFHAPTTSLPRRRDEQQELVPQVSGGIRRRRRGFARRGADGRRADQAAAAQADARRTQGRTRQGDVPRQAPVEGQQHLLRQLPRPGEGRRGREADRRRHRRPGRADQHPDGAQQQLQLPPVLERTRRDARGAGRRAGAQPRRDGLELGGSARQAQAGCGARRQVHGALQGRVEARQHPGRHRDLRALARHAEPLRPLPARRSQGDQRERGARLPAVQDLRLRGLPPGRQHRRQHVPAVRRDGRVLQGARQAGHGSRPGPLRGNQARVRPLCVQGAEPAQRRADRALLPRRRRAHARRGSRRDVPLPARPHRARLRQGPDRAVPQDPDRRKGDLAMKTFFRYLLRLVAACLLIAGFAFLYFKTYSSGASERDTTTALLRELRQIDAGWNAEVLRSKNGVSKDYDGITVPQGTALALVNRVGEQSLGRFDDRLGESQRALRDSIVRKSDLVDRYKRESAILRNSLRYIPAATAELKGKLREAADAEPQKRAQLDAIAFAADEILQLATKLEATTDLADARRLDGAVARLAVNRADYPAAIYGPFDIFAKHATQIAFQKARELETLQALAHESLSEYADALDKEARKAFDRADAQGDTWRTRFYVYCALMAALLVFLLVAGRRRSGLQAEA